MSFTLAAAAQDAVVFDLTPWVSAVSALLGALIGALAGVVGPLIVDAKRRKADAGAVAKTARGEAIVEWTAATVELANVHADESHTSRDYREPAARSNAAMAKLRMCLTSSGDADAREFARRVHAMTSEHGDDGDLERRFVGRASDQLIDWHETGTADFRPFAYLPDLVIGESWEDVRAAAQTWFAVYREVSAGHDAAEADARGV
ncbi:hypothetical protein SOM10_02145 [Microbacterium sp. CFBP9023]|uniref:hypothetical protein n=1 Tax=Microbacterium sp. CFBP9023 TaxID=3096535 RepID=UPI002A6A5020|nr:hypothetical protein [Microbacterium sp. CFBP9023]MDY0982685.1 hypothetical protein [Microbacterium sp. CFBP9023]